MPVSFGYFCGPFALNQDGALDHICDFLCAARRFPCQVGYHTACTFRCESRSAETYLVFDILFVAAATRRAASVAGFTLTLNRISG